MYESQTEQKHIYELTTNASHNSQYDVAIHPKLLIIREQLNEATRTMNNEPPSGEIRCKYP
jgi:hypothetical protein